jgi:hypothetical protein
MTQKLFHDLSMLITLPFCLCPNGLTFSVIEPADQLSQNIMSLETIKIPYYNFCSLSTFIFLCCEHTSLHCLKFMEVAAYKVTNADTENFLLPWMYTWHMGSRRYTSHIRVVTIDIQAFLPPWHQGSYPSIEEIRYDFSQHNYLLL